MSTIFVTPYAYMDDLSGRKVVVKIKDTAEYVILAPPDYSLDGALRGDWVLDSAVTRHGYTLFTEPLAEVELSRLGDVLAAG